MQAEEWLRRGGLGAWMMGRHTCMRSRIRPIWRDSCACRCSPVKIVGAIAIICVVAVIIVCLWSLARSSALIGIVPQIILQVILLFASLRGCLSVLCTGFFVIRPKQVPHLIIGHD